jgi:hypothetical protein
MSRRDEFVQVARTVPFDNTTPGASGMTSEEVQAAIEELRDQINTAASPGFTWGNSGVVNNAYLLNDTVPSNKSGRIVPVTGNIKQIFLSLELATAVTIEIRRRVGLVYTPITSVTTLPAERLKIINVSVPVVFGDELSAYVNGNCKSPVLGVVIRG